MVLDTRIAETCPAPEKVGSKRLEWSSTALTETSSCDAKSLAARRKRSEIRRFRLMAAASFEGHDEPFGKRSKLAFTSPKVGTTATHGFSMGETQSCKSVSEGQIKQAMGAVAPNSTSAPSACTPNHTTLPTPGTVNEGDEGGSTVESRLTVSECMSSVYPSHCVVSICGRSREMEDAAIAVPSFLTLPSSNAGQKHARTFHFYGVYDGHGGPQAADYCKERMHGVLADEMCAAGDGLFDGRWEACFQSCFEKLDAELCGVCPHGSECPRKLDASSSSCREPLVHGAVGTTAVVAVVGSEHIVVGNCGDSRAVLSRGGQVVPLSYDHKANRPDEVARIEAAGGHVFTWQGHRVCGVLAMSRSLGDSFLKPFVSGQPEVTITARSDDDEFLILASDGLWDALSNEFVCGVARKALANWRRQHRDLKQNVVSECQLTAKYANADAEDSPAHVVAALLTKLALAKYSKDNISVVVVDLKRL